MKSDDIVIVAAKRTPIGAFLGGLSTVSAPKLGSIAHSGALESVKLSPNDIDEVISGCVLQAGIGQAPARQAAIFANMPYSTGATTINKMCGSGMKAVMMAHDLIQAGSANIVIASGMENMSLAPYLLSKARTGYRLGHGEIKDHMFLDGLEDAYDRGKAMGCFADNTAKEYQLDRGQQDEFAIESMQRALAAQASDAFAAEITPVTLTTRKGETIIAQDENPDQSKIAKVSQLKPVFDPEGTVTAASSSSIADGAATLILMRASDAEQRGLTPLARIVAHSTLSQEPQQFTTAPIGAIKKVMERAGWQPQDVDLYEINEAFAVVTMAAIKSLELDPKRVNIHGGACALGHPIGASGARILVTLIHALQTHQKTKGIAALCIGGGEATAMAIELMV
ncbi:MAG: acetyl-CoA C-acyltransferase [Gammaproteobacteria bacterium]|nr:acetyl-CoA C-acyltransferase [Gammaproteobacteria bacterium]